MPDYPIGLPIHTSRPILDAYADFDALARACPNCGAAVQDFCRLDGGNQPLVTAQHDVEIVGRFLWTHPIRRYVTSWEPMK